MAQRWKTRTAAAAGLIVIAAILFLPLASASAAKKKASSLPWKSWVTKKGADNLLTGRIWSTRLGYYLSPYALADTLALKDFILLGETHDNPDHHRLQAWLMRAIARHDRRPTVVMEMIGRDQQQAVDDYISDYKAPISKFGTAVGWEARGWPDWKIYQPIARVVYSYRLKIAAGNGSKETIRNIGRRGYDRLEGDEVTRLALDKPLEGKLADDLLDELKVSHCGMVPDHGLEPMAKVQNFRDALMADQMLEQGTPAGAFLIAGNGHVRTDRGVPYYLKRRDPYYISASVMMIEITDDAAYPEDLIPKGPDGEPAADFFWFTPRAEREDPCEKLKGHFKKDTVAGAKEKK